MAPTMELGALRAVARILASLVLNPLILIQGLIKAIWGRPYYWTNSTLDSIRWCPEWGGKQMLNRDQKSKHYII